MARLQSANMTYKDFSSWLQGVIDVNPNGLNANQLKIISDKISKLTYPQVSVKTHIVGSPPSQVIMRC